MLVISFTAARVLMVQLSPDKQIKAVKLYYLISMGCPQLSTFYFNCYRLWTN